MKLQDRIKNSNFNYVRNGRWFFIAPAVILVLGIIMLAVLHFNLFGKYDLLPMERRGRRSLHITTY